MTNLTESERLTARAVGILHQRGWPLDAIKDLSTILIGAGFHRCLEMQAAQRAKDMALIEKVAMN